MSRFRCNSCQGEYDDVAAGGVLYFHACPPVTLVRVRLDSGIEDERPLRAWRGFTIASSDAQKAALVDAGGTAALIVVELARADAPRAGARDENTLRRGGAHGEIRVMKAEGRGRAPIPALPDPAAPVDDVV